jgi:hypothetical protein
MFPSVKELKVADLRQGIKGAIVAAVAIRGLGSKFDGQQFSDMTDAIVADVQIYFKALTLMEIVKAIEMGAKGMFERDGDMNVVTIELILKWVRRYIETVRKEALYKQRIHEEKIEEAKNEEKRKEGEIIVQNEIIRIYNIFCQTPGALVGFTWNPVLNKYGVKVHGKFIHSDEPNMVYFDYPLERIIDYTPDSVSLIAMYYEFLRNRKMIQVPNLRRNYLLCVARGEVAAAAPDQKRDNTAFKNYQTTKEIMAKQLAMSRTLKKVFIAWNKAGKEIKF